ncbi:ParB/RepB/Spo0J family partition protein [Streptomyces sp. HPF1205]|uniref:ParB/RepB/Spo0J family partition protein n=1 Tax=Streptomyces sp. HPF1205 TaxID=2873262 RepID=UPI001CEDA02D|nr:ParB/RepB/Spo0J family partition protein [Streptomyces sp. HPF1205]
MTATTPADPKKTGKAKPPGKAGAKAPAKKTAPPAKNDKRPEATEQVRTSLRTIPTDRIDRDPQQPREVFDPDKLKELADSIKELGQLQPISVRYIPATKRYTLIMGERRWRAARLAGLTEMQAVIVHGLEGGSETADTFARSLAENVGRADMTPLEEARGFQRLIDFGYSIEKVASVCGKSWNHVDLRLSLLKLVPAVQEALLKGHIPVGLAWYVAQVSQPNQNAFLARWTRGLFSGPRDAEAFCQKVRSEEQAAASQGVLLVLAEEAAHTSTDMQEGMFGELEVPVDERERVATERAKLVRKIDRLSVAGEILTEIAAMDPAELALLLSGAHGGIPGNRLKVDHLKTVAAKASTNIRQAAAVAQVRAGALRVAPDAQAVEAADSTETAA